ncbi:MAG: zinc ribbon domain-containing protein [Clostridia bacterium]|nr:zinc ribbon domain-containing protein [Clostridia bacterium]
MFCPQCGAQHEDDAVFCSKCGTQLNPTTEKSSASYPTPQYRQPSVFDGFANTYNSYANRKLSSIPTIDAFKKLCLSPICLIAVISYTLMVLMNLSMSAGVSSMIQDALSPLYLSPLLGNILDVMESSFLFTAILFNLPDILTAVGLWMLIYSASLRMDTMSSSGLNLIRKVNTVMIVLISIFLVLAAIVCFAAFASFDLADAGVFFFTVLILLGGTGLRLFFLTKVNNSIDCAMYAVDRHIPTSDLSSFVMVMCFISGIFSATSVFASTGDLSFMGDFAYLGGWSILISLFTAVAYICFGVLILLYKNTMEPLRHISAGQQGESTVNYIYREDYNPYNDSPVSRAMFYVIGIIVFLVAIAAVAAIRVASM